MDVPAADRKDVLIPGPLPSDNGLRRFIKDDNLGAELMSAAHSPRRLGLGNWISDPAIRDIGFFQVYYLPEPHPGIEAKENQVVNQLLDRTPGSPLYPPCFLENLGYLVSRKGSVMVSRRCSRGTSRREGTSACPRRPARRWRGFPAEGSASRARAASGCD